MYDTVIIIPYRNRKTHLDYFLEKSVSLLSKNLNKAHIVIVEQSDDKQLFNRGKLLNVGIQEYKDNTIYCMTHDIDINPSEATILKHYTKPVAEHEIVGVYTSQWNTLGGIIKFTPTTMLTCNGFPNDFWGWGAEDKALQNRCEYFEYKINKNILNNDPMRHSFFTIFNDVEDRIRSTEYNKVTNFEYYEFPKLSFTEKKDHIMRSGINNLTYTVLNRIALNDHVTHLVVSI